MEDRVIVDVIRDHYDVDSMIMYFFIFLLCNKDRKNRGKEIRRNKRKKEVE